MIKNMGLSGLSILSQSLSCGLNNDLAFNLKRTSSLTPKAHAKRTKKNKAQKQSRKRNR